MEKKFSINKDLGKLPFKKFEKWFNERIKGKFPDADARVEYDKLQPKKVESENK